MKSFFSFVKDFVLNTILINLIIMCGVGIWLVYYNIPGLEFLAKYYMIILAAGTIIAVGVTNVEQGRKQRKRELQKHRR